LSLLETSSDRVRRRSEGSSAIRRTSQHGCKAEPNTVVIAEGTRRLLGNLFELEDLGAKDLKGVAVPLRGWAALTRDATPGQLKAH
jgi:hypothetical protein